MTKITIVRSDLAPALASLGRIIEKRNTIPILANILVSKGPRGVSLRGTDLDMQATAQVPAEGDFDEPFTIHAGTLDDIVRKLPEGPIAITAAPGGSTVLVSSGRSRFTLHILPAEDFPEWRNDEAAHRITIKGDALAAAINKVSFAISTEETRYYLNGIHIHSDEAALVMVATDGHRLALTRIQEAVSAPLPGIILPRKAASEFARLAAPVKGNVTLEISERQARLVVPDCEISTKLIDGTFPDYRRVIPNNPPHSMMADRQEFAKAAERVTTMSGERGRRLRLALATGEMTLASKSPEIGEGEDAIGIEYNGALFETGFNGRYLAEILGAFTTEKITMAVTDSGSPVVLKAEPPGPDLCVLMPMRV